MKKIVVLTGSPRKNGNSGRLAAAFTSAAEQKGYAVTAVDTYALRIGGCMGCGQCYKNGQACYFNDDFDKIAPLLMEADAIVLASPLYWFAFPAKLKAMIDKWTAFTRQGRDFSGKTAALLACSGLDEKGIFTGMEYTFDTAMRLLNCHVAGKVLIGGVYPVGAIGNTDGEAQAAELVERLFV